MNGFQEKMQIRDKDHFEKKTTTVRYNFAPGRPLRESEPLQRYVIAGHAPDVRQGVVHHSRPDHVGPRVRRVNGEHDAKVLGGPAGQ